MWTHALLSPHPFPTSFPAVTPLGLLFQPSLRRTQQEFPGGLVLGLQAFIAVAQVQSLVSQWQLSDSRAHRTGSCQHWLMLQQPWRHAAVISRVSLSKSSGTSMPHSSPWDTASIMSCPCSRSNNGFLLSIRMRHLDVSQDSPEFCSLSLLSKMIPPFQPCWASHHGGLVAKLCLTLATPWTVACQVPLSMGFSRQEYWNGLPFICPGDLPNPEIELGSPALQADSLLIKSPGKPIALLMYFILPLCMALGSSSLDCPFCFFLTTHNYSLFHA